MRTRLFLSNGNNYLTCAKGLEQVGFDHGRRRQRFHLCGERMQSTRQHLFVAKSHGAILARVNVSQRFAALLRRHHLTTSQLTHNSFEFLTVHAKHLADFTVAELASSNSPDGLNLASRSARALCKRDRTVPIAQPKISAVSP